MSDAWEWLTVVITQAVYAVVVYNVAIKRREYNVIPWVWTCFTLIPFLGVMLANLFLILSFLSVLDRLTALESRGVGGQI